MTLLEEWMSATDEEKESRKKIQAMTAMLLQENSPVGPQPRLVATAPIRRPGPTENPFPDTPFPTGLKEAPADKR